ASSTAIFMTTTSSPSAPPPPAATRQKSPQWERSSRRIRNTKRRPEGRLFYFFTPNILRYYCLNRFRQDEVMIPEVWLEEFNTKMASKGVPHIARPFKALSEWTRIHPVKILMNSQEATAVFEWFYRNSPPGAHNLGPLFTGIFYFDAVFWPVKIP